MICVWEVAPGLWAAVMRGAKVIYSHAGSHDALLVAWAHWGSRPALIFT